MYILFLRAPGARGLVIGPMGLDVIRRFKWFVSDLKYA